jgi:AcrR family transcriptional regulator
MERQSTEKRQQQIVYAALKIIAEQGLGKFTTSAIAKEVGISEGALFRHFKSKQDIVLAVIDYFEKTLFENFPPVHEDPLSRLELFVEERLRRLSETPSIVKLLFSDQLSQASGEEGLEKINEMQVRSLQFVLECLQQAKQNGSLREDLQPEQLLIVVFGGIMGAVNQPLYRDALPAKVLAAQTTSLWKTLEILIRR